MCSNRQIRSLIFVRWETICSCVFTQCFHLVLTSIRYIQPDKKKNKEKAFHSERSAHRASSSSVDDDGISFSLGQRRKTPHFLFIAEDVGSQLIIQSLSKRTILLAFFSNSEENNDRFPRTFFFRFVREFSWERAETKPFSWLNVTASPIVSWLAKIFSFR